MAVVERAIRSSDKIDKTYVFSFFSDDKKLNIPH